MPLLVVFVQSPDASGRREVFFPTAAPHLADLAAHECDNGLTVRPLPEPMGRSEMAGPQEVYSITGAQSALTDDQAPRTRRYLVSMGIRTACVIAAIIVPGWPRWVLIAGAVILPYIAVVAANAGRSRVGGRHDHVVVATAPRPSLPGQSPPAS